MNNFFNQNLVDDRALFANKKAIVILSSYIVKLINLYRPNTYYLT